MKKSLNKYELTTLYGTNAHIISCSVSATLKQFSSYKCDVIKLKHKRKLKKMNKKLKDEHLMKTGNDRIDTELEKNFNELDDLHLAQHIGETLKGLGSPDVKIWDKDDYLNFYRNEGIRILTRHRAATPEQAGKIYDQKFKEICNEYSDFDIDKIFKTKMELQKVLYPAEFILLGDIEDVNETVQNDFQGEPEVQHEKNGWLYFIGYAAIAVIVFI